MVKQNKLKILAWDKSINKCGKAVNTGYIKPSIEFINYLALNNSQNLPLQHGYNTYHVIVDKLNTLPHLMIKETKSLNDKFDMLLQGEIPKNSPEFLTKDQYYALFFDEYATDRPDYVIFPPIIQSEPVTAKPSPPPVYKPPLKKPLLKKNKKHKHKKKHKYNPTGLIITFSMLVLFVLTFGWLVG